ncbi:MAG: aminoacyl-tRNA hydrolase [Actinomycetaceae bacterium]|nr:aminoacyl-tRNA hydrolase [Actinomycetaceae bacterium]
MTSSSPWLVVGLGNPGPQYADTRHNVGHMAIDCLARRCSTQLTSHRSGTHIAEVRLGILPGGIPGPKVILAVSDGYMNTSGGPISRLAQFLGIDADHLLVLHDELDLPAHTLRLKTGGGEGGHNGLKSLSQSLGTKNYHRLRMGIGRPPGRQDAADFVLARIPAKERTDIDVTVEKAADVVEDIILNGFAEAQQRLHTA